MNDKEPEIDKEAIANLLNSLKYPLYFIDYESYNVPIPEIEGTQPYQQLPFQYSLHIIDEDGNCEHKEFLAEPDDEDFIRHFAESMVNDLSEDGSVIVYNKVFEESHVNKKLAEMFPDLKDEIYRINGNMVDFRVPFMNRDYYVKNLIKLIKVHIFCNLFFFNIESFLIYSHFLLKIIYLNKQNINQGLIGR